MKTLLFNPFRYIAGLKSLLLGWALILITACIAFFSKTHFDGAIDAHVWDTPSPVWHFFAEPLIGWGCMVLVFFATGKFFSSSAIRFIDIAGTFALARWPFIFLALVNFAAAGLKNMTPMSPQMVLIAIVSVPVSVWIIALMWNALKVSCNIKGSKGIVLFIVSLIVAEILSKIILHYLYQSLS